MREFSLVIKLKYVMKIININFFHVTIKNNNLIAVTLKHLLRVAHGKFNEVFIEKNL